MFWRNASGKLLRNLARYRRTRERKDPVGRLINLWSRMMHQFWSLATASDIHRDAQIEIGVKLPHPNGVIVHQDAVIETDCMIMQQVTIGQTAGPGAPHLERGAYVGAGAKILGPVRIGAEAAIGANAVVLIDVPAGATAVGVPARIIEKAK